MLFHRTFLRGTVAIGKVLWVLCCGLFRALHAEKDTFLGIGQLKKSISFNTDPNKVKASSDTGLYLLKTASHQKHLYLVADLEENETPVTKNKNKNNT